MLEEKKFYNQIDLLQKIEYDKHYNKILKVFNTYEFNKNSKVKLLSFFVIITPVFLNRINKIIFILLFRLYHIHVKNNDLDDKRSSYK